MALSWNEIKDRALRFTKEWEGESRERAEKDTFWNDFFNVFGISRRRLATFEEPVKKLNNAQGFIDLFWKGTLLVEHKSKGRSLDAAFEQASDYFHGIKEHELPKYVLVSDFENFRLYDLDEKTEHSFHISDFHKNIKLFGFIAGYQKRSFKDEDEVNIAAAELMGKLHDQLEDSGYQGHDLEVYLVRLLFCLFADDTGIFEKDTFKEFIEVKTAEDGSNLGAMLAQLFQVLNTPREKRMSSLDEHLMAFPYVNGKLFEEFLMIPAFNSRMREILLQCSSLNWGKISPAIFGSMFQSVMDPKERRNLGAHYTSEKNILKLIKPLFLDELWEEFHKIKGNKRQLQEFQMRLGKLKFLDPACGCGNFLIITYRELRLLEIEVVKTLFRFEGIKFGEEGYAQVPVHQFLKVDVDQFYGIEYDEFPSKIAEVALWLMDHQMNLRVSEEFGLYYARLPLKKSAKIVHGNALRINWEEVVPKEDLSYILGNPPFIGKHLFTVDQQQDMAFIMNGIASGGLLDYVAAWYVLAARYVFDTQIKVGFVSTNSILQGEQAGILWNPLFKNYGVKIHFAHRTFTWNNEAKGNAAVKVIIIGFACFNVANKLIFEYSNSSEFLGSRKVKNINPYLIEGQDIAIMPTGKPICNIPKIINGSKPVDGGNLILSEEQRIEFINSEPLSEKFIKQFAGAEDYIKGKTRYCLWLKDVFPAELKLMPLVLGRIQKVREFRLKSPKEYTRKKADFPMLFEQIRQPESDFILIPRVSSENRKYIPLGFLTKDIIVSDTATFVPDATHFHFGVLTSEMHMAWVRVVCGRLKSDFRYSNDIVYNNFPWPKNPSEKNKALVEEKAQKVLDTRAKYPDSSLADLYDPLLMPPDLVKTHQELDRAVDQCYRPQPFTTEMARIEYLFELYEEYLTPLLGKGKKK